MNEQTVQEVQWGSELYALNMPKSTTVHRGYVVHLSFPLQVSCEWEAFIYPHLLTSLYHIINVACVDDRTVSASARSVSSAESRSCLLRLAEPVI